MASPTSSRPLSYTRSRFGWHFTAASNAARATHALKKAGHHALKKREGPGAGGSVGGSRRGPATPRREPPRWQRRDFDGHM
jgi:hypothetical protein